jgi:hypothetical protein
VGVPVIFPLVGFKLNPAGKLGITENVVGTPAPIVGTIDVLLPLVKLFL